MNHTVDEMMKIIHIAIILEIDLPEFQVDCFAQFVHFLGVGVLAGFFLAKSCTKTSSEESMNPVSPSFEHRLIRSVAKQQERWFY
jgi:hypothetical protein